jgi:hypothetical protein
LFLCELVDDLVGGVALCGVKGHGADLLVSELSETG